MTAAKRSVEAHEGPEMKHEAPSPVGAFFLCAQRHKHEQGGSVVALDSDSLDAALRKGEPLMVDFYAPW